MSVTSNSDQNVAQLIDANLDRAKEGLRVIEDWGRYVLKDRELVIILKNWRHQLGQEHREKYKRARLVKTDKGAGLAHPSQLNRNLPQQIVEANFARVQEALRVLEEFARLSHPELSKISEKIRYEIYDLEIYVLKSKSSNFRKSKLNSSRVYLITKPHKEMLQTVISALKAGITMVQFRCKDNSDIENLKVAKKLAKVCKDHGSLFIINDRVDLALASEADGVHLGQEDLPIKFVREILGAERIIGLSTHSLAEIKEANSQDCNYIGVGPIYKTTSKPNKDGLGLKLMKEVASQCNKPWFAIGGINKMNVSDTLNAGVSRIAVINAIMDERDPYSASKELLEKMK